MQDSRFDAFNVQPALEVTRQRTCTSWMRYLRQHPLWRSVWQQIQVKPCLPMGHDLVTQQRRRGIDQAAFDPGGRRHKFTPALKQLACRGSEGDGNRLERLSGIVAGKVRAPTIFDIKAAIGGQQGCNGNAVRAQPRNPPPVAAKTSPTAPAQSQQHCIGVHLYLARWRDKVKRDSGHGTR
ncbi:hypothetical protein GALL_525290 [mine drainage metagenome]|uniref:Uncharacterized protein n=1 Tax=mine drainage metagenome TaxID=410659 RepID=A0A1J5PEG2_9ZZZZ